MIPAPRPKNSSGMASPGNVVILVTMIVGLCLLPFYRYHFNGDTPSYLSVATHYYHGRWHEAINGYWSPMFSWLIALLMFVGATSILATKFVGLGAVALSLHQLDRMMDSVETDVRLKTAVLAAFAVFCLVCAYGWATPDLLFAGILLLYCQTAMNVYQTPRNTSHWAGLFAGLAFLTKSFALPFFVFHFTALGIYAFFLSGLEKRRVIVRYAIGVAVFSVIAISWAATLSTKYEKFTFGTAGGFNLKIVALKGAYSPVQMRVPDDNILIKPGTPHAINSWEDPSLWKIRDVQTPPLATALTFVKQIPRNIFEQLRFIAKAVLPLLLAAVFAAYFALKRRKEGTSQIVFYWLATVVLYCAGFWIIFQMKRYLLFPMLALVPVATALPRLLAGRDHPLKSPRAALAIVAVSMGLIAGPALYDFWSLRNDGLKEANLATRLTEEFGPGQRIVTLPHGGSSNSEIIAGRPPEEVGLTYLVTQWGGQFYGLVTLDDVAKNFEKLAREFKENEITQLLVWNEEGKRSLLPNQPLNRDPSQYPLVYDPRTLVKPGSTSEKSADGS